VAQVVERLPSWSEALNSKPEYYMIHLIYCKNLRKYHDVPLSSTHKNPPKPSTTHTEENQGLEKLYTQVVQSQN
jgi:hypothetical protein